GSCTVEDIVVPGQISYYGHYIFQQLAAASALTDVIPYSNYSDEETEKLNAYILAMSSKDGSFSIQLVNADASMENHLLENAVIQARVPYLSTDVQKLATELQSFSKKCQEI